MAPLSVDLRNLLQRQVLDARRVAEDGARQALKVLGVEAARVPDTVTGANRELSKALRAKMRQLGGLVDLIADVAYEQWHRMLFARFLEANGLLMFPEHEVAVNLAECAELAPDLDEPDEWMVAARFASAMLPGIFRPEDPSLQLRFAAEDRAALEAILAGLPPAVFRAEDSLGWVYQFWQSDAKKEVNKSGRKIGGGDLAPITQLFTEHYMVRFLLENSLGAWWAARHPDSLLVKGFDYLRIAEGRPAAGSFDGWPERVANVTVMDPCCGSGHFLVEAFSMLWQMRAEEEGILPVDAQDAVLQDNLFGLELDPRCVQIAMFAVALQAWKAGGGWRQLPAPNIACSGIPVKAPVEEWKMLAGGDERLKNALGRLHILFRDADTLGSLIDPKRATESNNPAGIQASFEDVDWEETAPILAAAARHEAVDPTSRVLGADAVSIVRTAELLSRRYTLIATNVPYLGSARFDPTLHQYIGHFFPAARWELATAFVTRSFGLLEPHGTQAVVTPGTWCSLKSYRQFREGLLDRQLIGLIARLGPRAFGSITGEVVQPVLVIAGTDARSSFDVLDASIGKAPSDKAEYLRRVSPIEQSAERVRRLPESRIPFEIIPDDPLLEDFANSYWGIGTGDGARFGRFFWELPETDPDWALFQGGFNKTEPFTGRSQVLLWEGGNGSLRELAEILRARLKGIWRRGQEAWGKEGIAVNRSGRISATLYTGEIFESLVATIIPKRSDLLPAIWAYCSSEEFDTNVRAIDSRFGVTNLTLLKVPFDIDRWRAVASEQYVNGLPEPYSSDPTQWLFRGHPCGSAEPLQVAVARLIGYRWPDQEPDDLDELADEDGIVPLPAMPGKRGSAVDRLLELLARAYGSDFAPGLVDRLLSEVGATGKTLEEWLRDTFFAQHCKVFRQRPFVWQIHDGRKDGFSALIHYHRLNRQLLEKLSFSILGNWIEAQRAGARSGVVGADFRLAAAEELQRRLQLILDGDAPHDIYVRWKSVGEQSVGWDPDLDDGVRFNIRPFVQAKVLRVQPKVKWGIDRGTNPDGTKRDNDVHLTRQHKQAERGSS